MSEREAISAALPQQASVVPLAVWIAFWLLGAALIAGVAFAALFAGDALHSLLG
jgi:hypothetical protein